MDVIRPIVDPAIADELIVSHAILERKVQRLELVSLRRLAALQAQQKGIARLHKNIDKLKYQRHEIEQYANAMPNASYLEVVMAIEKFHRKFRKARKNNPGELGAAMGRPCPEEPQRSQVYSMGAGMTVDRT